MDSSNSFAAVATARAESQQKKLRDYANEASIRYVFAPIFPMIVTPLSTVIEPGRITPISEQAQPVGEVYLQTLVRDGEYLDAGKYNLKDGVGEIIINPAPIIDNLVDIYGAQGCIQLKSLFNQPIDEFLSLDLNALIFGDHQYETADEYLERFAFVRDQAKGASFATLLLRVLAELEASVNVAFAWARAKAQWANEAIKVGDIRRFAPFENRLFKFSNITPIDEAMNQVALDQKALANSMPEVVRGLREAITESKPDWKEIGAAMKEAVVESRPDWREIGAAISAGVKEGVSAAISALKPETATPKAVGGKKAS